MTKKKSKQTMQIYSEKMDRLWGEDGPYSEARLIFESRILYDRISRIFVNVEVAINPYTFEFIKDHRQDFKDDIIVQQLLDFSEYRGDAHGYVSSSFCQEHTGEDVIMEANEALERSEQTIIKLHKYIMKFLDKSVN